VSGTMGPLDAPTSLPAGPTSRSRRPARSRPRPAITSTATESSRAGHSTCRSPTCVARRARGPAGPAGGPPPHLGCRREPSWTTVTRPSGPGGLRPLVQPAGPGHLTLEVAWDGRVARSVQNFVFAEENAALASAGWLEHVSSGGRGAGGPGERAHGPLDAPPPRPGAVEAMLGADAENLSGAVRVYECWGSVGRGPRPTFGRQSSCPRCHQPGREGDRAAVLGHAPIAAMAAGPWLAREGR
jgi:hypothetical protein